MRKIISSIPNTLTMGNLVCGCIAIIFAFDHNFIGAFWAIIAAAVFDFFDGFSARMLGAYSPLGGQLDSLSDMVSFGIAPAFVMFNFIITQHSTIPYAQYISLVIAICAAFRLAKFNIDPNQSDKFIGLPSPAAALFMVSFVQIPYLVEFKVIAIIYISYMMVCKQEMFALKFKDFSIKNNRIRYVFLLLSVILIAIFGVYIAPAYIIILYILMSMMAKVVVKR